MHEPVGILGSGRWGMALARLAADAGRDVMVFMRDPDHAQALNDTNQAAHQWPGHDFPAAVRATASLADLAEFARFLLMAVPSHAFRGAASALGAHVRGDHIIVHTARGIEAGTHRRMSDILREETPVKRLGALAGPVAPGEVMAGQPAGAVVGARFPEVVARTQAALAGPGFRVYGSSDLAGVEIAGALNNVVAVCAGVLEGVGLGAGTRAMLITRGAVEIRRLGLALGAAPETFSGLAGIGDLMVACSSEHSIDYQVGRRLASGEPLDRILASLTGASEGVRTASAAHAMARSLGIDMPIVHAVYSMLHQNADPAALRDLLMARSARYEADK